MAQIAYFKSDTALPMRTSEIGRQNDADFDA
jgi:hypothetical protein